MNSKITCERCGQLREGVGVTKIQSDESGRIVEIELLEQSDREKGLFNVFADQGATIKRKGHGLIIQAIEVVDDEPEAVTITEVPAPPSASDPYDDPAQFAAVSKKRAAQKKAVKKDD